jgi:hypothetical protein
VILIGARNGGWYDKANGVSITRQEYRWARESFLKTGRPHITAFVRESVWDVREDRVGLRRLLADDSAIASKLSPEQRTSLLNHPSKLVDEVSAIFAFIAEIGQVDAMKAASSGMGQPPAANWIHQFRGMDEIADALRIALRVSDVRHEILRTNLQLELLENLRKLLMRQPNGLVNATAAYPPNLPKYQFRDDGIFEVNGKELRWLLGRHILLTHREDNLGVEHLSRCLQDGIFLRYEPSTARFETTLLHDHLRKLYNLIQSLKRDSMPKDAEPSTLFNKFDHITRKSQIVTPNLIEFAVPYMRVRNFAEVGEMTRVAYLAIDGDLSPLNEFKPLAVWSPFPGDAEKIIAEAISDKETVNWAKNPPR